MSTAEDHTNVASGMAEEQGQGRWLGGLREGYAEIGDVRLHYVEAGDGPLIVLRWLSSRLSRRHRLRSCGLTEAPSTLPPATVERPATGRRVRQVQRAAVLHSVQVDHGIERLSRTCGSTSPPRRRRATCLRYAAPTRC